MESEEFGHQDLSVGSVCQNYEEPGPRGSAAHFLLGVEIEGHPPGNKNVEGVALTAVLAYCFNNINDSNKCQSSSPIDDNAVDVVSAAAAVDVAIYNFMASIPNARIDGKRGSAPQQHRFIFAFLL